MYNTIAGYRRGDGTCVRVGNYFFDKNTFLRKEGNEFYYDSVGDHCRTYEGQNISFIIKYRYFNKEINYHEAMSELQLSRGTFFRILRDYKQLYHNN